MSDQTGAAAEVRTFLIADVRGYTRFTQEHGDEAAARLAARFAEVVGEVVEARGGTVVELRGDEALCVFASPRGALRAAADLQQRCAEELRVDPSLPLRVGIGIDAGEAVPVAGGYRGGALNLAARLCSVARGGEVLLSEGVAHLARRVDELTYVDRGRMPLKGIEEPVRVLQLQFELDLPSPEEVAAARWTPMRLASLAVGLIFVAAAVVALAATRIDRHHSTVLASNVVAILDSSGSVTGQVGLGGHPGGVAAGGGAVWATNTERALVAKIDSGRGVVVDTVRVGTDPMGVAVGGGGVWVTDGGAGKVWWINAKAPSDEAPAPISVGQGPGPIAYGEGGAWVINSTDATLQRISSRLEPSRPAAMGGAPSAVAVGGGWVWVADAAAGSVLKVDPGTLRVVARLPAGNDPEALVFGGGSVWIANRAGGTVTRLDPRTGTLRSVAVGRDPSGLAFGNGAVWVAVHGPPAVARIDPGTLDSRLTPVASVPQAIVTTPQRTWATALAPLASHRGGTLRMEITADSFPNEYSPFDPAVAPYGVHWQMLAMTNDGLVTYRRVGGAAGLQVVPDLAVAMPAISPDGRTYTFQLRPGIRYSNGDPVKASDFRYAVERQFSPAAVGRAAGGYYQQVVFSNLVGYNACKRSPASCSMTRAIETDDAKRTISIHLTRPDPALPQKLATPFGDLVPPGSPAPDSGQPVPATGPYMIADADADGFVLRRNPHFRQWSVNAQPAGYPDVLRWTFVQSPGVELTHVEQGTADVMLDPPPPGRVTELRTRYPTLAHPFAAPVTSFVSLNTRQPPFNNLAARRALNFAIDRRHVVELLGGEDVRTPTCQVLPPGMFGYAPYCPYTADPTPSGAWTGPDLAKAQQLVRASGTRGQRVVVWAWAGLDTAPVTQYVADVLDQLGYRASTHITPNGSAGYQAWSDATQDSRSHVAAGIAGWYADYPNPIDFFDVLLTCRVFSPADPANQNTAELCDPRLDQLVRKAEAVQISDPAKASALWQEADREAVDQAPWVPLVNNLGLDVVSDRAGNYQRNPQWGALLDQLWVR
jgi:ABC-type transport system substrate-binding protein/class 3 adenylate cyclase